MPLYKEINNLCRGNPEIFMEKIVLETTIQSHVLSKKVGQKPNLKWVASIVPHDLWDQLNVLRRLYKNKSKGKLKSPYTIMTQKRMVAVLGKSDDEYERKIKLKNISASDMKLLRAIGFISVSERHLEFVSWLGEYLDSLPANRASSTIEDML